MAKNLTILFVPLDGVGHVNACIGLGERLRDRGHKIVFALPQSWKGVLVKYGFVEEILEDPNTEKFEKPGDYSTSIILKSGILSGASSLEKKKTLVEHDVFNELAKNTIKIEPILKAIIERQKPNLFIIDHFFGSPSIIYSDKPWVHSFSPNPLYAIEDDRTPPGGSVIEEYKMKTGVSIAGYPINGDRNEWKEFKKVSDKAFEPLKITINKWLVENGYPEITGSRCIPDSPYLNLYGYPEELDYTDVRPMPDKWFRIDTFMREGEQEFKLPDILIKNENNNDSKKLIYFSLGSMGSADVNLMKKLISILAKSSHKFIVSKGPLHNQFELADNMWGERYVPQTKVLPLVDLVITHGGNNTVTETFSFGKPMIVMPLFADQYDNAQRIHEKGFGIRLDPYNCTEEELLTSIENVLNNDKLKVTLTEASNRIRNSQSYTKAVTIIENLVK